MAGFDWSFGGFGQAKDEEIQQQGSQTRQRQITTEGLMELMKQVINDPTTGLASIYGNQASAGGYGGSMAGLLTNDLLTRAAGTAALASAKEVTTSNNWTNQQGQSLGRKVFGGFGRQFRKIF